LAAFCDAHPDDEAQVGAVNWLSTDRSPEVERSTTERTVRACWTTYQTKPQITIFDRTSWTPEAALPR
jgi:hypothetical protein